jgi:hypothetical protein
VFITPSDIFLVLNRPQRTGIGAASDAVDLATGTPLAEPGSEYASGSTGNVDLATGTPLAEPGSEYASGSTGNVDLATGTPLAEPGSEYSTEPSIGSIVTKKPIPVALKTAPAAPWTTGEKVLAGVVVVGALGAGISAIVRRKRETR